MVNILVTGGCGFIGSHFINHMYDQYDNIKIINIDALYYCANKDNVNSDIRENTNYVFIKGNLCDDVLVKKILIEHNYSYVVCLSFLYMGKKLKNLSTLQYKLDF